MITQHERPRTRRLGATSAFRSLALVFGARGSTPRQTDVSASQVLHADLGIRDSGANDGMRT